MPKLMLFAACEKALIDKDNNLSVICFLTDLSSDIPESEIKAANVSEQKLMLQMRWDAMSLWVRTPDDDGEREYQQRIALLDPSGESTGLGAQTTWKFGDTSIMRNIVRIFGFPVYATGRYVLKLWMQEKGEAETAEPQAEYAITLKLGQPKG